MKVVSSSDIWAIGKFLGALYVVKKGYFVGRWYLRILTELLLLGPANFDNFAFVGVKPHKIGSAASWMMWFLGFKPRARNRYKRLQHTPFLVVLARKSWCT